MDDYFNLDVDDIHGSMAEEMTDADWKKHENLSSTQNNHELSCMMVIAYNL